MLKKYTMGFNAWALVLFAVIILPTVVWGFIPAPDDILRTDSVTPVADTIANISRVAMIFALCAFINTERNTHALTPMIICVFCCAVLYYAAWGCYFLGLTGYAVIIGMTLPPSLAFILYAIDRKNMIALVPAIIFTICHAVYGAVNFII